MGSRLLVVEDEPSMLKGLVDVLTIKGYAVEAATRGDEGLEKALSRGFDLVLLDVMLPGLSGFDVLRRMREAGVATPVILLTAKNTEMDKVLGFELGVDDYVTKPFSLLELMGRIGAVLRRAVPSAPPSAVVETLQFGPVQVDLQRYRVTRGEIPAKGFDILRALASRRGQVVSRDELIDAVWGADEFINHRTVNNLVVKVRQVIEDDPADPRHLVTVHGVGYRLEL